MRTICYLLLFVALAKLTHGAIWQDEDAIIIDDSPEQDNIDESFDFPNRCVTSDGAVGSCIPARECFPYAYTDGKDFYPPNSVFIRSVANFSEPCTIEEETTVSSDVTVKPVTAGDERICCATLDRAIAQGIQYPLWQPPAVQGIPDNKPELSDFEGRAACSYTPYLNNPIVTEQLKIIGGDAVSIERYPFMVALFNGRKHHCGASLINSEWILTAAHCVTHLNKPTLSTMSIWLGTQNINAQEPDRVVRSIKRVVLHNRFNFNTFQDDVALIKLNQPVTFNNRIRSICLNHQPVKSGVVEVAGWGKTHHQGLGSPVLRAVQLPIWSNAQCSQKYKEYRGAPAILSGMICAGQTTKDSCQGDSGGPLTDGSGNQIGIVSWGIGCGQYPGVYTRISDYAPWIQRQMSKP